MLVLLYCLSQNPDFSESVKPLMSKLRDSEQMLGFLKELSSFTETFSAFKSSTSNCKKDESSKQDDSAQKKEKEKPQSPTEGIADEFIQNILESYLKQH